MNAIWDLISVFCLLRVSTSLARREASAVLAPRSAAMAAARSSFLSPSFFRESTLRVVAISSDWSATTCSREVFVPFSSSVLEALILDSRS